MAEHSQHKVSEETIRTAREYGKEATGRSTEQVGKTMSSSENADAAIHNRLIEQQAKTMVVDSHIKAAQAQIESIEEFLRCLKRQA